MESLTLNVRVDANDKKSFEKFCNEVGINVSTAVNMFIKTVLREQRIPFEVRTNSLDERIYQKLKEAEREITDDTKRYSSSEVLRSMNDIIGWYYV